MMPPNVVSDRLLYPLQFGGLLNVHYRLRNVDVLFPPFYHHLGDDDASMTPTGGSTV